MVYPMHHVDVSPWGGQPHPAPCHASFQKFCQMYGEKVDAFGENNNFW
jgi:hypothetical protein